MRTGSWFTLDEMTLSTDLLTRAHHAQRPDAERPAQVDETDVLRRCVHYREGFKGIAVSYPAALLRFGSVSAWMQRQRVGVNVATAGELAQAAVAGIEPRRIVVHARDGLGELTNRAVSLEATRFVLRSSRPVSRIVAHSRRRQHVLIDATAEDVGSVAADLLAHNELDLVGIHCGLAPGDVVGALTLTRAIGEMSWIRRQYDVLLTQISIADLDVGQRCERWILRRIMGAMSEVIDEACARHRFPRPALTLSPSGGTLLG